MRHLLNMVITLFFPPIYTKKILRSIPKAPEPHQKNIFALYDYHHSLGKKLIYSIKQKRDTSVSRLIAQEMLIHLQEYISEQQQFSYYLHPYIIPVPLTQKQKRSRGFNQVSSIARNLAQRIHGTYLPVMVKTKKTEKQALIKNKSQRFLNVHGCFDVSQKNQHILYNKDIIIVDDLVTTGATLLEMEKVLRTYGARTVIAITIGH